MFIKVKSAKSAGWRAGKMGERYTENPFCPLKEVLRYIAWDSGHQAGIKEYIDTMERAAQWKRN